MKATIWMILLSINQAICSSPPSYSKYPFFFLSVTCIIKTINNLICAAVLRSSDKRLSNFLNNDLRKIMREKEPIYDPYLSNQHIIDYRNKIIKSVILNVLSRENENIIDSY